MGFTVNMVLYEQRYNVNCLQLIKDLCLSSCSVLDVVAGLYITAIRTYSSVGEYFGSYDGNDSQTPQLATNGVYTRDVMARSFYGQYTWGAVHVGCPTNGDGER